MVRTSSLYMNVCLKRKRMLFTRLMVTMLGNPTHLSFWYDEGSKSLIVSAASKDDLDAYEILPCYWKNTKQSCEVSRIAFLTALQYRRGWEDGSRYTFEGSLTESGDMPAVVFNLANGVRLR